MITILILSSASSAIDLCHKTRETKTEINIIPNNSIKPKAKQKISKVMKAMQQTNIIWSLGSLMKEEISNAINSKVAKGNEHIKVNPIVRSRSVNSLMKGNTISNQNKMENIATVVNHIFKKTAIIISYR